MLRCWSSTFCQRFAVYVAHLVFRFRCLPPLSSRKIWRPVAPPPAPLNILPPSGTIAHALFVDYFLRLAGARASHYAAGESDIPPTDMLSLYSFSVARHMAYRHAVQCGSAVALCKSQ